ncbi:Stomatin like transmembrane protein [Fasciola hepatica]|uniref:Stomatin like transmembrane protein n=1 Tax=Fasciola hepatica TaxID=6192 RepID=A0A2H1CW00_FASHE|nr:Stomatin like transmembrane protein [Fasciola hepatica]
MLEENESDSETAKNNTKQVRKRTRDIPSTSVHVTPIADPTYMGQLNPAQIDLETEGHGCCGFLVIFLVIVFYVILFPLTIWFSFTVIQSFERGVVLRLGKLRKQNGTFILGSGIQFVLPCVDTIMKVDMRTITVTIPSQDVLTRDSVTVGVDAVVYMRVINPAQALLCVQNWTLSTELLAVSSLRTVIGTHRLAELLSCREQIDARLKTQLDEATGPWGINVSETIIEKNENILVSQVERVEIKDVSLPQDMQRAMAAEAQATQAAQAKVIAAKGELDSSQMLQEAAQRMSTAPGALQLRYLQTLATIATERNSTIIFPLPMELLNALKPKKQ